MNKKQFIGFTAILIIIEQWIKIIINKSYLDSFEPILKPYLYFKPMFNRDYSWINSLFQLGVDRWLHIVMVGIIIILIILIYSYLSFSNLNTKLVSTSFGFLLAGGICSLIDKVLWNGSLDYIYVNQMFTFDLKDLYIDIFIGLILIMFIFDHKKFRTSDDDHFLRNFIKYLRRTPN